MAYRKVNDTSLASVADAIRAKGGTSDELVFPDGFVSAIGSIQTGGGTESGLPSSEEVTFGYVKKTETVTEQAPDGKCWYNGVLLPEIPADVLASYPYAWIRKHTTNSEYQAIFSASGFYYNGSSAFYDKNSVANPKYVLSFADGTEWTVASDSEGFSSWTVDDARPCMWSNHDIPNGSATATGIYFKGSEPITELTETITKLVPVERESNYSITSESLNNIAKRTQEMAGTSKLLTPDDIIYWLKRVLFVPQGQAESILTLTEIEANGNSSGMVATVYRGTAISELIMSEMICNGSASGVLEE